MRKIIAVVSALMILPLGVFAAVDSVRVSGDISTTAVSRDFQMGEASNADTGDYIIAQTRVQIDARLTEGVTGVIRLLNERIWGAEDSYADNSAFGIDLAYVELKEFLSPAATLIVGRQNLRYGSGLIIGDPDTNQQANLSSLDVITFGDLSLRKSFDAARVILDYAPYVIDLVYAKVSEGTINVDDDVNILGVNASYAWDSHNGVTEGYLFLSDNARTVTSQDENAKTYVLGTRAHWMANDNLFLSAEGAYQFGDYRASATSHTHLNAWAAQLMADYRFLDKNNSRVGLVYTYLSGDDPGTNDYEGWDPMFEDQTAAEIINILFTNSNCHMLTLSGSFMPREDITLGASLTRGLLAEKYDSVSSFTPSYGAASGNSYAVNGDERELGDEIDLYMVYDYTEDVQLKVTGAWFSPGDWFTSANDDTIYSLKGGLTVSF